MKRFGVILVPTWQCNNTCDHCFEHTRAVSTDPSLWPLTFRRLREYAETAGVDRYVVYWQGGEVLTLPPDDVQRALDLGNDIFQGSGCELEHHLQSNLIPYHRRWAPIISQHFRGSISSSLDYPNIHRSTPTITPDGYTAAWLAKKNEALADGLTVNLISLPSPETLERGAERFYAFYRDEAKVENIQVNFPFTGYDGRHPAQLDLALLRTFMRDLYAIWVHDGRRLRLNPLEPLEERLLKGTGTLSCAMSHSCASYLVCIGPQGEVGQCDCWVSTRPSDNFGTLAEASLEALLQSPKRKPFLERATHMLRDPECAECAFWSICCGGCPVRAQSLAGSFYARDYYCPVYRGMCEDILVHHRAEVAKLAQKGQQPVPALP